MQVQGKADQVSVEAVDAEMSGEEGLSLPTSLSAALVAQVQHLVHVLAVAVVKGALVHGDQEGQIEEESHLPLLHDDQMAHVQEILHHAFQTHQEACTCQKCVCMCMYMYIYTTLKMLAMRYI